MARLILTLNNKILGNHQVSAGKPITIGRHADNQIVIDNLAVSAHHAKVHFDGRQLMLTDLGSRNGTLVNNQKSTRCPLTHQDWISVGKHIIIVDLHETLSLETSNPEQLIKRNAAAEDADQTIVLEREEMAPAWISLDYLSFFSTRKEDFELTGQTVSIGKNPDADIRITGLHALFAGSPSATITKRSDTYLLTKKGGWTKVSVNDKAIKDSVRLNHQDIVAVGPVRFQIRFVRRPSH